MQIFVKCVGGDSVALQVDDQTNVGQLKTLLVDLTGVSVEEQHLTYGLHALDDEYALFECGVEEDATIFQCLNLLGAGKKRKKKQYTKPKKIKHKKKKVKMAVLKFYKVDGNDKVNRMRKECPSCGNGVFMAMHHNRNYCGRCGITYIQKAGKEEV